MRRWLMLSMTLGFVAACAVQTPLEERSNLATGSPQPVDVAVAEASREPVSGPTPLGARAGSPHPSPSWTPGSLPSLSVADRVKDGLLDDLGTDGPGTAVGGIVYHMWGRHVYLDIKGQVADEYGNPVPYGKLTAILMSLRYNGPRFVQTVDISGGSYALHDLPACNMYTLIVNAPGYVPCRREMVSFDPPQSATGGPNLTYFISRGIKMGGGTPIPVPDDVNETKPWPDSLPACDGGSNPWGGSIPD